MRATSPLLIAATALAALFSFDVEADYKIRPHALEGCWLRAQSWGSDSLCFQDGRRVETCSLDRFEGLCNEGKWLKRGSRLSLVVAEPAEGWPTNVNGDRRPRYDCRLNWFAEERFELLGCELPGFWQLDRRLGNSIGKSGGE